MQYLHDKFFDCFKILHRGAVLLEEYICRVNMAYMVKLGKLRANKAKCYEYRYIQLNIGKYR